MAPVMYDVHWHQCVWGVKLAPQGERPSLLISWEIVFPVSPMCVPPMYPLFPVGDPLHTGWPKSWLTSSEY